MLNKSNVLKTFKFDYGNLFNMFLSYLIQFMANTFAVLFAFWVYMYLMYLLTGSINNVFRNILFVCLTVNFIAIVLFFVVLTFLPRRIILNNSYIKIQKHAMNFIGGETWFSSTIPYSSIVCCSKFISVTRRNISFLRQRTYPCTFFNRNSLVEITDKFGKKYYVPVKNAEEFIKEVNRRINSFNDYSN